MSKITIIKPDDFHTHLREAELLALTVRHSIPSFTKVLAMPNLQSPVTTCSKAHIYQNKIMEYVPQNSDFAVYFSLYLTEETKITEVIEASKDSQILGFKYYPHSATTNSNFGVKDFTKMYPIFEKMAELGVVLLVHGEVTDSDIDIFDREKTFISRHLNKLRNTFPELKIVLEHLSSHQAVDFILENENIAGTITPQHLLLNRSDILTGGIHPHYYCLPVLKREHHRQVLITAATSGSEKFFLGTDSAPHLVSKKESSCGCAGIYSAPFALSLYLEIFEQQDALNQFETFASINGANFYNLPINKETITLTKQKTPSNISYQIGNDKIIPLLPKAESAWMIAQNEN